MPSIYAGSRRFASIYRNRAEAKVDTCDGDPSMAIYQK